MKAVERIALIIAGGGFARILAPALIPVWAGWVALLGGAVVFAYAYFKGES